MEEVKKQGMESLFVPYEIALSLKELGFDEPCFAVYEPQEIGVMFRWVEQQKVVNSKAIGYTIAPLYQQAFRFFREKYNLCGWVQESYFKGLKFHQYYISKNQPLNIISNLSECTYEEAELECLKELIELCK